MIKRWIQVLLVCVVAASAVRLGAMFDNRYCPSPILERPFIRRGRSAHVAIEPFLVLASRAYGVCDSSLPLFDISGSYDLYFQYEALRLAGLDDGSLMRPDWDRASMIPFCRRGQFTVQGIGFSGRWDACSGLSAGFKTAFMHAHAAAQFLFDENRANLTLNGPGDEQDLLNLLAQVQDRYGFQPPVWTENTLGDLDMYVRYGFVREYWNKFRIFDVGIRAGCVVPFASPKHPLQPLSVPLGGDRHFAIYGELDAACVLKEDIHAGLELRLQKRFSRIETRRMPIYRESADYGILEGPLRCDPGVTWGVAPYLLVEHLRGGFGVFLGYYGTFHACDTITDMRPDQTHKARLDKLCEAAEWSTDYITVGAIYDTASECESERTAKPIFALYWDIPAGVIGGKNAFKSNGIGLWCEMQF